MPREPKHTGNWQGGKVTKSCKQCADVFLVWKHRENTAYFCSRKCSDKSRIGKPAWNSGKPQPQTRGANSPSWKGGKPNCIDCGKKLSLRKYKRCTKCCFSDNERIKHLGDGMLGKKHATETIEKMRQARLENPSGGAGRVGELNNNWKGGITPLVEAIRKLGEYKKWRSSCLIRDGFLCQECGDESNHNLNVDHITPFSIIVQRNKITTIEDAKSCAELWDTNNGRTLCVLCHRRTLTWGYNSVKLLTQIPV